MRSRYHNHGCSAIKAAMTDAELIAASLEITAARRGDITGAVYARLFAALPDTEALFFFDPSGAARGAMLTLAIEMLGDAAGPGAQSAAFLATTRHQHREYGVAPEVYPRFFAFVRDEVCDACGTDWTAAMAAAWTRAVAHAEHAAR
jgi:hemoglobin-like flavoprotein